MLTDKLIPHLFRAEFTKITSVLCKAFGLANIELAEDIASETFLSALETWTFQGLPENPTAWLYTVAKNKARNHLNRNKTLVNKVVKKLSRDAALAEEPEINIDLSEKNITDSQLQMLFAVCHPSISVESKIGLALRILCGFGIDEIATAFLTNKETINKRLFRAKEKLRVENIEIAVPAACEMENRLQSVLTTIYLLFNEGYYSESKDSVLREDLCFEAMRLTNLLVENKTTDYPDVKALLALMCFHASRFKARKNNNGELVLYADQDDQLWDWELIARGVHYLKKASGGNHMSRYHIEASIAYWHTIKKDSKEKWQSVLQLYDQLLQLSYSPIAALNRVYAFSKVNGNAIAIPEAEKLALDVNHYYHALLGELYKNLDHEKALTHLQKAFELAKTEGDKSVIKGKIIELT